MRKLILLSLFALSLYFSPSIFCQEVTKESRGEAESENTVVGQMITGDVVSIDLENSTLTIKEKLSPDLDIYNDLNIQVAPEAKLVKNDTEIMFSDIQAGDTVEVQYVTGENDNRLAMVITVK